MTPVSAKIITSKVDEKRLDTVYNYCGYLHTVDFGDIRVLPQAYKQVMINDTISFSDDCSEDYLFTVYRVNGKLIER